MIFNKRNTMLSFLILVLIFTLYSCIKYRYVSPYAKYDHEKHEAILEKNDMNCFTCHKVDINETDPIKKLELLKALLKDNKEKYFEKTTCHKCHNLEDNETIRNNESITSQVKIKNSSAPTNCKLCHEFNMKQIMPLDHQKEWVNTHGVDARSSTTSCYNCHQKWFCVDCHTAVDFTSKRAHNRMFRITHVSAAMADPASCDACHKSSFCIDCHSTRGR